MTDAEFAAVYAVAPESIQVAMDLALLTGLRRADLLNLTRADCLEDGIHVRTSKTGKRLVIGWNDELRAVVERAKRLRPQFRQHLIATRQGKPYRGDGFSCVFRAAVKRARLPEGFRSNDIRAKSASDSESLQDASERLGHSSQSLTKRVYRRKPSTVRPLSRLRQNDATEEAAEE